MEQSKPNTIPSIDDLVKSTNLSPERVQRALAGLNIAERLQQAQGVVPNAPVALGCDYHGKNFGAPYPDARCIDGYLWDEDSCDEPGGPLMRGGDIPCPECNGAEYIR